MLNPAISPPSRHAAPAAAAPSPRTPASHRARCGRVRRCRGTPAGSSGPPPAPPSNQPQPPPTCAHPHPAGRPESRGRAPSPLRTCPRECSHRLLVLNAEEVNVGVVVILPNGESVAVCAHVGEELVSLLLDN